MSNPLNPIDNFFFSIFWLAIILIIFFVAKVAC